MQSLFQKNFSVLFMCLALTGCGKSFIQPEEIHIVELKKAKKVEVVIRAVKAEIIISGGAEKLMAGKFNYFLPTTRAVVDYHEDADQGNLLIHDQFNPSIGVYPTVYRLNVWTIALQRQVPFNGSVDLKEGQIVWDVRQMNVEKLEMELGKVSGIIDLAKPWTESFYASVRLEDGQLVFRIPQGVGVRVEISEDNQSVTAEGFKQEGKILKNETYQEDQPALRFYVHPGQGKIIFETVSPK